MTKSSRALIVLSLFLIWPMGARSEASEAQEKESAIEKPASSATQAPAATDSQSSAPKPSPEAKPPTVSDSQPTPPKPVPEAKPHPPAAPAQKSDTSTEHKEVAPEKSVPRLQQSPATTDSQPTSPKPAPEAKPPAAPTMKADLPPDREVKDKEPALRKTLGSLILSVKLALMGDSRLFHYEIEVEDDEQTVTLSGRVSTEEEKTTAKEVAQKVHGVKNVVNKLTVEKDLAKTLSKKQDDALSSLVKERFSKSATLKAANFEVKTEEGVVLLNGTVRFQVIALEAAEAARQVPGVRAVNTEKVRLEGES